MKNASVGLIAGLLLALAIVIGGVGGFFGAIVLGAIGYAVGAHLDGDLDLSAVTRGKSRG